MFTIIAAIGVVNEGIAFGGATGSVYRNAPYIITFYTVKLSMIALLVATAYFNNAALRDYQHHFNEILFATPIRKVSYYFGRFLGAFLLSIVPLLGVFLGFSIGTDIALESNQLSNDSIGVLQQGVFINNFLLFVVPNMFVSGSIIFAIAYKYKSTVISFIATIIIIVAYLISAALINDIHTEGWAAMLDVLGGNAYLVDTKYLTPLEKNTQVVSLSEWLLFNRLFWIGVGVIVIISSYYSFSFVLKQKPKKKNSQKVEEAKQKIKQPSVHSEFNFSTTIYQFRSFFKMDLYAIVKSNTFKILLFFGVLILLNKLSNGFEYYGLQSYHITSKMIAFNRPISMIIGMIILVFFSGELVWKERNSNIAGVLDGTPHNSLLLLISKISALVLINIIFDLLLIAISVLYQMLHGVFSIQLDVYLLDMLYSGVPLYLTWACILIGMQIIINHKYLAYFIAILCIFLFEFLVVDALGIQSFMLNLGFSPAYIYSDMNGFGPELLAKNWFSLYWVSFGVLLITTTSLLWVRGTVKGIKNRFRLAFKRITSKFIKTFIASLAFFLLVSGYVYYNTQLLNNYYSASEIKDMQAKYEMSYKKYEQVLQPTIIAIDYTIDVYPYQRNVSATSIVTIKNTSNKAIDSLHYSLFYFVDEGNEGIELKKSKWIKSIKVPNAKLVLDDKELGYQIFKLDTPLKPNETMKLIVDTNYQSQGFENEVSNIRVVKNGTFFDSSAILPTFGYELYNELTDKKDRKKYGLPLRKNLPDLNDKDKSYLTRNYITGATSPWVDITTQITTSQDQIAVAPGSLQKKWTVGNRTSYQYKNDHSSLNFTSFMSAKYKVATKQWSSVNLEVYYDASHDYNIDIMLEALKKSLEYYTEQFGPYMHKQARVVEIPKYYNFAQAFPGTMPYTEGGGFVTNLSDANDNNVIYALVTHEMAHQYWGHQVVGAKVAGATMLSESFAEYSSLMVLKNTLKSDEKMKQFLAYDFEKYLRGRGTESQKEQPLLYVKDQDYIHYGKGSLVLYALQEYIGESKVNTALRAFLKAYKYQEAPYPTSLDFLRYLKPQIPEELQYLLKDWFEEVTLYDYRLKEATYTKLNNGNYKVNLTIDANKIKVDSLGKEKGVMPHDWVDIAVYVNDKELLLKRVLFNQKEMRLSFEVNELPSKAVIDPKRLLIERNIEDNSKKITLSQQEDYLTINFINVT
ncbi:M1 family aminopeptidase [Tenacibaculum sp.]|uniref:M1 family aminopeptidase n=1 Tax=Tenacibaculum sp. TaxID=1906242 RepID=UPI003D10824E